MNSNSPQSAVIAPPSEDWWLGHAEVQKTPVFAEELMLLLPPGSPQIASLKDINVKALAAFGRGCTYRSIAEDWIARSSGERIMVHEVRSYHAMFACTTAGSCISVLPRSVIDLMRRLGPVGEQPLGRVDTYLAWRPGFDTAAFSEFRATLAEFSQLAGR